MSDSVIVDADETADPMIRRRMLVRNFIEYSAPSPAGTVESSSATDGIEYLYRTFIKPVQLRFASVFDQLLEQGRIKNLPTSLFYFQLTAGGLAPFGQIGLVTLMSPELATADGARIRSTLTTSPRSCSTACR